MKLSKYLLILSTIIFLNSNLFGIDIESPVVFFKENTSVSFYKKQNELRIFGYTPSDAKRYSPDRGIAVSIEISIPIEKHLIGKDAFGRSLVDFFNINPKEVKVELRQIHYSRSDKIEKFSIQPEIDFIENDIFEIHFKFTHNNKIYTIFLNSIKSKPNLSEIECLIVLG